MNIYNDIKILYPICRSITGKGIQDTLNYIQNQIPLKNHSKNLIFSEFWMLAKKNQNWLQLVSWTMCSWKQKKGGVLKPTLYMLTRRAIRVPRMVCWLIQIDVLSSRPADVSL